MWMPTAAHLLVHFGLKEYEFYTVLFGVSRSLGCAGKSLLGPCPGLFP